MSPKTNTPSLEPPVQRFCHQHFCFPDVQHTDSGEQGRRAPAHHHQQHGERERWAQTQMSRGSSLGVRADLGQALVRPGPDRKGECSAVVVLLLEELRVLVITSELAESSLNLNCTLLPLKLECVNQNGLY